MWSTLHYSSRTAHLRLLDPLPSLSLSLHAYHSFLVYAVYTLCLVCVVDLYAWWRLCLCSCRLYFYVNMRISGCFPYFAFIPCSCHLCLCLCHVLLFLCRLSLHTVYIFEPIIALLATSLFLYLAFIPCSCLVCLCCQLLFSCLCLKSVYGVYIYVYVIMRIAGYFFLSLLCIRSLFMPFIFMFMPFIVIFVFVSVVFTLHCRQSRLARAGRRTHGEGLNAITNHSSIVKFTR